MSETAPQQTPPLPNDYFENLDLRVLTDRDLADKHARTVRQHDRRERRAGNAADEWEQLDSSEMPIGARGLHVISEVLSRRSVTDPYSTATETPRAAETKVAQLGLGKIMGKLATAHSVEGPNGQSIRENAAAVSGDRRADTSRGDQRYELRVAKARKKHLVRQARSRSTEATFSAGQGLGVQSKTTTFVRRTGNRLDLRSQFRNGEIDADELLRQRAALKSNVVSVAPRAVRRDVRRERLSAGRALAAAKTKPTSTAKIDRKKEKLMGTIQANAIRMNGLRDQEIRLAEERRRRDEL